MAPAIKDAIAAARVKGSTAPRVERGRSVVTWSDGIGTYGLGPARGTLRPAMLANRQRFAPLLVRLGPDVPTSRTRGAKVDKGRCGGQAGCGHRAWTPTVDAVAALPCCPETGRATVS